ncbi:GNAT family N-acetyltransferase [Exiguobacterium qingdaonense]|uniref:GNAT family N-acetyltransferase n=1 Tax=Exiguobacterium qingdaonense TaxID=2751251 RepID=UPI001BEBD4E1|nr:GNAT family N-acetyltransferase [Exiguobacterium qingdaonense]
MQLKEIQNHRFEQAQKMLEIQRNAYAVEAELIGFDEIPARYETIDVIQNLPGTSYGLYTEEQLIGFVTVETSEKTVEITKLCIDPTYFRAKLATTLLEHMLNIHEGKLIYVHTGKHNGPARRLYTKLGFVPSAEFEPEPGVTLIRYTHTS